jgi:hypothetical protein
MTFSRRARPSTAHLIACRELISSPTDIFKEVDCLAAAEGLSCASGWKEWGAVGLLPREAKESRWDDKFASRWESFFQLRLHASHSILTSHGIDEPPAVDEHEVLTMEWPRVAVSGEDADVCDVLLAAVNAPTLTQNLYATADEIAQSCVDAGKADYFMNNVMNDIRTADDREIWQGIADREPGWHLDPAYAALAKKIQLERV